MGTLLAEARAGSPESAAMTAMLIHAYPEQAQQAGINTLYESLLWQALQSTDPDFLACLAEELMIGRRLAADARMGVRAAAKSDAISGFMGSYVIGRLASKVKSDFALKKLRKGRRAGHVASIVISIHVMSARVPVVGVVVRHFLILLISFYAMKTLMAKDMRRLWRGLDVFGHPKQFTEWIGPDRELPFARVEPLLPARDTQSAGDRDDTSMLRSAR